MRSISAGTSSVNSPHPSVEFSMPFHKPQLLCPLMPTLRPDFVKCNLCRSFARCVAFNPSGDRLLSVGDDKQIFVWDSSSGDFSNVEPIDAIPCKVIKTN